MTDDAMCGIMHEIHDWCICPEEYTPTPRQIIALDKANKAIQDAIRRGGTYEIVDEYEGTSITKPVDAVFSAGMYMYSVGYRVAIAVDEAEVLAAIIERISKIIRVHSQSPTRYLVPTDPVNRFLFSRYRYDTGLTTGEHPIPVSAYSKKDVYVVLSVLQMPREALTPLDMDVCAACAAMWDAGQEVFSAAQIARKLYKRPNTAQVGRVVESITRMMAVVVAINNESESISYGRELYRKRRNVVCAEITEAVIDGNYVRAAVHLLTRPITIEYADVVKQIAATNSLYMPISETDQNRKLYQYLRDRVSMRRSTHKALWSTVLDTIGQTGTANPGRIKKDVRKIMTQFVTDGIIKSWSETADGIEWTYRRKARKSPGKKKK